MGSQEFSAELGDQKRYLAEARNLLEHGTFAISMDQGPTAFDGPGYAAFLMPFLRWFPGKYVAAAAAGQAVVSLLTAWLLAQMTWRITQSIWAARIALLWWCIYPFSVFYSAFLLSETLYVAALCASVFCAYGFMRNLTYRSAIVFGAMLGLASLVRPTVNFCIPFLFLAVLISGWDRRRETIRGLVTAGIALAVVLVPWTARNYRVFGRILPGSTQTGRMLFLANNPDNKTGYVVIPRDANPPPQESGETELEYNDRLGALAKEFIRENPGQFVKLCTMRLFGFWWPMPIYEKFVSRSLVLLSLFTLLPLFVMALGGIYMLKKEWRLLFPILSVVLSTYLLHLVFGVSMRYRFPIESLLIPPAAYCVSDFIGRFRSSRV
ncbi:MAG TPA: glycosyltransferase 87 family protein [bacterium]|nr:glycosyltransferase 87 family protein [bacterium]HQP96813.1 glycosyltransferase 87 family protein [bacterium]